MDTTVSRTMFDCDVIDSSLLRCAQQSKVPIITNFYLEIVCVFMENHIAPNNYLSKAI